MGLAPQLPGVQGPQGRLARIIRQRRRRPRLEAFLAGLGGQGVPEQDQGVVIPGGGSVDPNFPSTPTFTGQDIPLQGGQAPPSAGQGRRPTKGERLMNFFGNALRGALQGLAAGAQPVPGGGSFGAGFGRGFQGAEQADEGEQDNRLRQAIAQIQLRRQAGQDAREQERFERERTEDPVVDRYDGLDPSGTGKRVRILVHRSGKRTVAGELPAKSEAETGPIEYRQVPGTETERGYRIVGTEARPISTTEGVPFRLGSAPVMGDLVKPREAARSVPFVRGIKPEAGQVVIDPERGTAVQVERTPTGLRTVGEPVQVRKAKPRKPSARDLSKGEAAQVEDTAADALLRSKGDAEAALRRIDDSPIDPSLKAKIRARIREKSKGAGKKTGRERLQKLLKGKATQ